MIDPQRGILHDPACGSGGMFVKSAKVVEELHVNPTERLTFSDKDFGFAEALREIHGELASLNAEAVALAATIQRNFENLAI